MQGTELDFREPRPLGSTVLDHAFTDLDRDGDGIARFDVDGTTLWMDSGYGYAMVFTGDPLPERRPAEPGDRADDLPAERVPHRRRADPPRARRVVHRRVGHRAPLKAGASPSK